MGVIDPAADLGRPTAPETYSCFDFRLRSAIPIAELAPAEAERDERPVVELHLGSVPEKLPGAVGTALGLQVAGGSAMLTVPNVARYLVRDGREIVVDPFPGASERNMRLFLLGSALGILCHQRGLLPLHANAIVANGDAVAFAGESGAGKSTLAAHFNRTGHDVLCDDICVVSFDAAGRPHAWPGLPRLKLWGDALEAFGQNRSSLDRVMDGRDKYQVPIAARPAAGPFPLRRLYVLARADEGEKHAINRLRGRRAMEAAMAQTYRALYLAPMGLAERHFRQCAALLAHVEVYEVRRAWGYDLFEKEADRLERHVAGRGGAD